MPHRTLKFAIFGNTYQAKKSASIQKLLSHLDDYGAVIAVDQPYHEFLCHTLRLSLPHVEVIADDHFEADFAISMGGDGTFLKTAARVGAKPIPILGVNIGRLGFLADVNPCDLATTIHSLYKDDYAVEERELIMVKADGAPFTRYSCALNDIAILKRDDASMISIQASVDGHYLTTFQADGLVVSTPTGSTAYSLSNGGPIIVPGTKVLSMTAVAPHSLNVRPIVIPDSSEITFSVESRSNHFLIALDGRSEKCATGTTITISKAPYAVSVVKRYGQTYFQTLRDKMMWGADRRE